MRTTTRRWRIRRTMPLQPRPPIPKGLRVRPEHEWAPTQTRLRAFSLRITETASERGVFYAFARAPLPLPPGDEQGARGRGALRRQARFLARRPPRADRGGNDLFRVGPRLG